jgi:hypothetical protein
MVKAPIIIADLLTALLTGRLSRTLGSSDKVAKSVALFWLANPFVTFLGEMWGSLDVILVFLTVLCVALVLSGRQVAAALPLAVATALRLSPIVAWLGIVIWVVRNSKSYVSTTAIILSGPVGVLGYLFWIGRGQLSTVLDLGPLLSTYSPVTQPLYQYVSNELFSYSPVGGFAVASVLIASFLALEMWRMKGWSLISLLAMEFLLLYGFAIWPPTAFLWVMPYLALWHTRNRGKLPYLALLFAAFAVSILIFNSAEITSNRQSFLFIPLTLLPLARQLLAGIESTSILIPISFLIRSLIVGIIVAYACMIFWKELLKPNPSPSVSREKEGAQ